jgi:hypothetical protein
MTGIDLTGKNYKESFITSFESFTYLVCTKFALNSTFRANLNYLKK